MASSVAGGQHPVMPWPSWCLGEAGIGLQSPSTTPPTSPVWWTTVIHTTVIVDHIGLARGVMEDYLLQISIKNIQESSQ